MFIVFSPLPNENSDGLKIKSDITEGESSSLYSIVNSLLKGNFVFAQPTYYEGKPTEPLTDEHATTRADGEKENVHSAQYLQQAKHHLHGLQKPAVELRNASLLRFFLLFFFI